MDALAQASKCHVDRLEVKLRAGPLLPVGAICCSEDFHCGILTIGRYYTLTHTTPLAIVSAGLPKIHLRTIYGHVQELQVTPAEPRPLAN